MAYLKDRSLSSLSYLSWSDRPSIFSLAKGNQYQYQYQYEYPNQYFQPFQPTSIPATSCNPSICEYQYHQCYTYCYNLQQQSSYSPTKPLHQNLISESSSVFEVLYCIIYAITSSLLVLIKYLRWGICC